jgi:hypothetical protein
MKPSVAMSGIPVHFAVSSDGGRHRTGDLDSRLAYTHRQEASMINAGMTN